MAINLVAYFLEIGLNRKTLITYTLALKMIHVMREVKTNILEGIFIKAIIKGTVKEAVVTT